MSCTWIVLLLLAVFTEVSRWSILKSRMMTEIKKNQMKRTKSIVEMRKRATILVKVMSDCCFGIGSLVSVS